MMIEKIGKAAMLEQLAEEAREEDSDEEETGKEN